jgi:glycopeptide antibiotics resistance protein
LFAKIFFFCWLFAITFISLVDYSSISGLDLLKGFGTGFWLHAIGYFIAGLLFILAFGKKDQTHLLSALAALFLLGVLFEFAQLHIPSRSFNPVDIAANGLGLVAFYVCYNLSRISRNKLPQRHQDTK